MKYTYYSFFLLLVTSCNAQIGSENMTNQEKPNTIEYNKLTEAIKNLSLRMSTRVDRIRNRKSSGKDNLI